MESIAVAKVYARRHRYEVDANQELIGLGAANMASGMFGGYPVTGGFSRTAVNDTAGARTPLASIITAVLVLLTVLFLTPLFSSLPKAALGAIIIVAVVNLIDVKEMRHIASVKRSDLIGLSVAFGATLVLGIELGILVAVVASMLVVFARMSKPHSAVLGRIPGTTSYRNVERFPEAEQRDGIRIVRIDAALSVRQRPAHQEAPARRGTRDRRLRTRCAPPRLLGHQRHRRHRRRDPLGDHHRDRREPDRTPPQRRQGPGPATCCGGRTSGSAWRAASTRPRTRRSK